MIFMCLAVGPTENAHGLSSLAPANVRAPSDFWFKPFHAADHDLWSRGGASTVGSFLNTPLGIAGASPNGSMCPHVHPFITFRLMLAPWRDRLLRN